MNKQCLKAAVVIAAVIAGALLMLPLHECGHLFMAVLLGRETGIGITGFTEASVWIDLAGVEPAEQALVSVGGIFMTMLVGALLVWCFSGKTKTLLNASMWAAGFMLTITSVIHAGINLFVPSATNDITPLLSAIGSMAYAVYAILLGLGIISLTAALLTRMGAIAEVLAEERM